MNSNDPPGAAQASTSGTQMGSRSQSTPSSRHPRSQSSSFWALGLPRETELRASRAVTVDAPFWRRRGLGERVEHAAEVVQSARDRRDRAAQQAAPYVTEIQARTADLHEAEHEASIARLRNRLDRLTTAAPTHGVERSAGIDPLGP